MSLSQALNQFAQNLGRYLDKTASKNVAWVESPDGYLDRTPVLQFSMTSVLFAF